MASTSLVDGQILQQIILLERSSESIILFFSKHSVQTGIVRCMRCLDVLLLQQKQIYAVKK